MNLVCHEKRRYGLFEQEARGKDMPVGGIWARTAFWAAVAVGLSYFFAIGWIQNQDETEITATAATALIGWKGAGLWLLAIYAWANAKSVDGYLISAVMAFGALGDVLIERNLVAGAVAFAIGHAIAIGLYLRNRRKWLSPSQKAVAIVVVPATVLSATFLTRDAAAIAYSVILGTMAALAWTSRFPRYRTGIGAMLFVASDILIFPRMGALEAAAWADYAVWGLYFTGQVLIVIGVTQTLNRDKSPGI
jgi:uncharacterized membrane protein YhhN